MNEDMEQRTEESSFFPGTFITFEGCEGSGKTLAAKRFVSILREDGYTVTHTREPGGSISLGATLREILLSPDRTVPPTDWAEALLFAAERAQHVEEVIRPALMNGHIVVCDRYIDSSVAYQGAARGMGEDKIRQISMWGTQNLLPDWTLLLDLSPRIGLARRNAGGGVDRLDAEDIVFHEKVREAFLRLAEKEPERFTVIDASEDPDSVLREIVQALRRKGH